MRTYIGRQQAVSTADFIELALGTPVDLWLGEEGESDEERAARLDAACDILADPEYRSLPDDLTRLAARVVEEHRDVFNVVPLARPARRRPVRPGVAA
ncbi:MAG: hypothetical protein HOV70_33080 [Streptomyces sp.]|nr:hypothetical protein [Streptomyces sp.]